jgi:hypothetical protein
MLVHLQTPLLFQISHESKPNAVAMAKLSSEWAK